MKIQLYNGMWLRITNPLSSTHSTSVDKPSIELDSLVFISHLDKIYPIDKELPNETNTIPVVHDKAAPPPMLTTTVSNHVIINTTSISPITPYPTPFVSTIS